MATASGPIASPSWKRLLGVWGGPLAFCLVLLFGKGLPPQALPVAAMTLWMAIWWVTEAVPIPATSLLPLVLAPLLGVMEVGQVGRSYGDPMVFLFLGGFVLALSIERWQLHRRLALWTIRAIGTSPVRLVLGFMLSTGFLSFWLSNTATAMLMLPTGLAVIAKLQGPMRDDHPDLADRFSCALLLGIAYAASIGGVGTLVGTPPNLILAAATQKLAGFTIGFAEWMVVGVPLAAVGLVAAWWYLIKAHALPAQRVAGVAELIQAEIKELGPMSRAERRVALIFAGVALAWMVQPWLIKPVLPLATDAVIAVAGALCLFVVPSGDKQAPQLMNWETAKHLPWGVLLLFGSGLAVAEAFQVSGLSDWLGQSLTGLARFSPWLIVLGIVAMAAFLSEVASNTATATMLMPVMAALGTATGLPAVLLMTAAALGASSGFMLPVATPPNAIVFATDKIPLQRMLKAGFWLDLGSIVLVAAAVTWLLPVVWKI